MITIAYITARKNPMVHWFIESLTKQLNGDEFPEMIFVDYFKDEREIELPEAVKHVSPLPSFCQGKDKKTKDDYFSPSSARNAGIVHANNPYIVFVDDVSAVAPNWWKRVKAARDGGYVVCGSYMKVSGMAVTDGFVSWNHVTGADTRQAESDFQKTTGTWLYGCSFGMPTRFGYALNGFDTMCDMIGGEDYQFGLRIDKLNAPMYYDRNMLTIESEEHHTQDVVMKRFDMAVDTREEYLSVLRKFDINQSVWPSLPRYDSSHAILDITHQKQSVQSYYNHFSLGDLRDILANGGQITAKDMVFPDKFWFSGLPLSEY